MKKLLKAPAGTLLVSLALACTASAPALTQTAAGSGRGYGTPASTQAVSPPAPLRNPGSGPIAPKAAEPDAAPGEILVGMRPGAVATAARSYDALGVPAGRPSRLNVVRLRLKAGVDIRAAVARLKAQPGVVFAEPNYRFHAASTPNDAAFSSQYGPQRVQADLAWSIWQPKASVALAVLDTGLDSDHPDITGKVLRDQFGVVEYDAIRRQLTDGPTDNQGHGTHTAGIAAAQTNNGTGVAGIAGWDGVARDSDTTHVKIMPVKVLDDFGNGTAQSLSDGITWAADNGAKVLNMSLEGSTYSSAVDSAIQYAWNKGCVIVAAAGNNGGSARSYPAGYNNVIAVGCTDQNDMMAGFSNYGDWVQVVAPGVGILSTTPTYYLISGTPSNYAYMSGTSMSCPHVAGEAALIWSQNPSLTNAQVRTLITSNVDPYTGPAIAPGGGRINVYRALLAASPVGTVNAVVLNRFRQPIPGAEVHLFDLGSGQFSPYTAVSGADGTASVSVPPGRYHIGAYKAGYNAWIFSPNFQGWQVTNGQPIGPIEIVLDQTSAQAASVFGFVRYDDNTGAHPIGAGVHIDVFSGGHLVGSADSDANGHYQINNLPAITNWWGWYTYVATWNGKQALGVNFNTWGGVPIRMDIAFHP